MTGQEIRRFHTASPFRPFRVQTASGKSIDVPRPDFMHFSPTGRLLTIYTEDDGLEVVDVLLVSSVEALKPNGTSGRRRQRK